MNMTMVNLQEEYTKTEIAKILNLIKYLIAGRMLEVIIYKLCSDLP